MRKRFAANRISLLRAFCMVLSITSLLAITVRSQQPQGLTTTVSTPVATQPIPAKMTNVRVVEVTKLGLNDEIIIARIKRGPCDFKLADSDLVNLKSFGVSPKVVAAMMESVPPVPATPIEPSDGKVRVFVTDSQSWETRWGASSSFSVAHAHKRQRS